MIDRRKILLPDLEEETQRYIDKVLDYLEEGDKLNLVDNGALYMLADVYDTYIKASKILRSESLITISDRGNKSIHPAYQIMKSSMSQAMDILRDFGLTLSSRGKIKTIDSSEELSPLMGLLVK